ncbi:MAG: response regulator transcription factor [Clostridia bacterium]|nr:response regulator transcription factor [Clostridia bacterium]
MGATDAKARILVVDDEYRMRRLIKDFLEVNGYSVMEAADGEEALHVFYQNKDIDLIVLDVMLPKQNGIDVLMEIRKTSHVPVIILTARSQENDELMGYNVGADQYITKPSSPKVLVARVEALLRRTMPQMSDVIEVGEVKIDKNAHSVYVANEEVYLSVKEFDLLLYLAENHGITLSRERILDNVWDYAYYGDARTIDTHITKLRKKLGKCESYLTTKRGVGYRFEADKA